MRVIRYKVKELHNNTYTSEELDYKWVSEYMTTRGYTLINTEIVTEWINSTLDDPYICEDVILPPVELQKELKIKKANLKVLRGLEPCVRQLFRSEISELQSQIMKIEAQIDEFVLSK